MSNPVFFKFHGVDGESAVTPGDWSKWITVTAPEAEAQDAFFVRNDSETTTESEAAAADPYGSFKFTVDMGGDDADGDDDDHDIIFDPDGDLMPPNKPVDAAEFEEQVTFNFTKIEFLDGADAPDGLTGGDDTEETRAADGPHQGRHDIGGYVPTSIIGADADRQAVGDLPDITTFSILDEEDEAADSFDFADLPGDTGSPVPPGDIIIMPGDDYLAVGDLYHGETKGGGETFFPEVEIHFVSTVGNREVKAQVSDVQAGGETSTDNFDFVPVQDDLETPVPPGEIIIMPDDSCPPDDAPFDPAVDDLMLGLMAGHQHTGWDMDIA